MRSHALDETVARVAPARVRELLVLWQHPEDRRILPVGRLVYDGVTYFFDYTVTAGTIEGFRELPGLGRLGMHFESNVLPTVLRQRVMDAERPDFARYVAELGLNPSTATPWEQIVESGGDRAGDTLQFMELPRVVNGIARARFLANGIRYIAGPQRLIGGRPVRVNDHEVEAAFAALRVGDEVEILPEEGNRVDENATLVTRSGVPLGWVPRFLAPGVRRLLVGGRVFAHVVRVNGPGAPTHLRLVLELETPVPEGFSFDPDGLWEVLSR